MDVLDPKTVAEINLTVTFITGQTVRLRGHFLKGKVEPVLLFVKSRNRTDNSYGENTVMISSSSSLEQIFHKHIKPCKNL